MTAADVRGWLVVGSAEAGSSDEELVAAVAGHLARHGPTEAALTGSPEELDGVLRSLGDRALVVVGGDGSAHVAVNALARTGLLDQVTVGLVPRGTANDLATHLGMPTEPRQAVEELVGGRTRQLDVLTVRTDRLDEPELVVNAVHAGLGPEAARRATPLKPFLGRLAYPVGVAFSALTDPGADVALRVDGEPIDLGAPALAVAVSNAPRLGGATLAPDARPDDARLQVLVVPARPRTARLRAVTQVMGRPSGGVRSWRGRTVDLTGAVGELDADGEELSAAAECHVEVHPGQLTVLAPS